MKPFDRLRKFADQLEAGRYGIDSPLVARTIRRVNGEYEVETHKSMLEFLDAFDRRDDSGKD